MTLGTAAHRAVPGRPLASIVAYLRPYWRRYAAGAAMAVIFVGLSLATPYIVGQVVGVLDEAMVSGGATGADRASAFRMLFYLAAALAGISVVSGVARFAERMFIISASREFEYDMRNDYFQHVQGLSRRFFKATKTGDIMARATNDLNFVRMFAGPGIMGSVDLIRLPASLAYMIVLSPGLTLTAMLPLPLVSFAVYRVIMYTHHKSKEVQEIFSGVTARAQENLAGAHVVRAYGIEDRESRAFRKLSEVYMRESIKLAVVQSLMWPIIGILIGGVIVLVLWRGGSMVIEGTLIVESFSAFLSLLLLIAFPLAELGWVLTLYQRGSAGMIRMNDVFAATPDIADGENTDFSIDAVSGAYNFREVGFTYDETPVLEGIDFDMPAGSLLGIVGPTGAGKTTIVNLMTREIDPSDGDIQLDGRDIRCVPLQTLRGSIAMVPQDTFIFSDTIENNLRVGKPEASRADLETACEVAQFGETVAGLSEGYAALLGERGVNLSGGQKQRLAIARAIIRDPRILILDDALSSVDAHTEAAILEGLRKVAEARTTVIVAHRLSAVQHADRILVVDQGRIVQSGTHDELLAEGGIYADMWDQQRLEAALEEAP